MSTLMNRVYSTYTVCRFTLPEKVSFYRSCVTFIYVFVCYRATLGWVRRDEESVELGRIPLCVSTNICVTDEFEEKRISISRQLHCRRFQFLSRTGTENVLNFLTKRGNMYKQLNFITIFHPNIVFHRGNKVLILQIKETSRTPVIDGPSKTIYVHRIQ